MTAIKDYLLQAWPMVLKTIYTTASWRVSPDKDSSFLLTSQPIMSLTSFSFLCILQSPDRHHLVVNFHEQVLGHWTKPSYIIPPKVHADGKSPYCQRFKMRFQSRLQFPSRYGKIDLMRKTHSISRRKHGLADSKTFQMRPFCRG